MRFPSLTLRASTRLIKFVCSNVDAPTGATSTGVALFRIDGKGPTLLLEGMYYKSSARHLPEGVKRDIHSQILLHGFAD